MDENEEFRVRLPVAADENERVVRQIFSLQADFRHQQLVDVLSHRVPQLFVVSLNN